MSPNGVYQYGAGGFPNNTFNATNYWVDVVFDTTGTPGDTTPPTVVGVSPPGGGVGVSPAANVVVTFSEAMDASTISGTTFILTAPGNTAVTAAVAYNAATNVATLTPSSTLAAGTTYTATVIGGTGGVKDLAGNALAANVTWSFTTGRRHHAAHRDQLHALQRRHRREPGDDGDGDLQRGDGCQHDQPNTGHPDRARTTRAVAASVAYDSATRVATLTPANPLSGARTTWRPFSAERAESADVAGNGLASNVTWSFTTTGGTACTANPIVCENQQPGNPPSEWDVSGCRGPDASRASPPTSA